MRSAAATPEAPLRSLSEVVDGVRRHETRLSALVRAYEAAEGKDDGVTDLLRDRGWDAANYLWDVDGAAKEDRLSALWTAEDPNIGRVVWILPAVLYALEPDAGANSFRFRDSPLRQWIVYALNECCDFMAKWLRGVGEDAEEEGANTHRDGSGDDGTPDEDADSLPVTLHTSSGEHVPAMLVSVGNIPPRLVVADRHAHYGPADYTPWGYAAHMMVSPAVEDLSPDQRTLLDRWTDSCAEVRRVDQEGLPVE